MPTMIKGIIKWFNAKKGMGFIEREGGPDIFFRLSELNNSEIQTLKEGDVVEFTIEDKRVSRIYLSGLSGDSTTDAPPPKRKNH